MTSPCKSLFLRLLQVWVVLVPLLFIGAAAASAAGQPDLMLRLASEGDGSYIGGGIYESTASLQSISQPSFPGEASSFRVLLKNAGDQQDSFILTGTGSGSDYTVRYLDDSGIDRAVALSGGGYRISLAPGESLSLLVQVTPVGSTPGASYRATVSAASLTDSQKVDQVKTETVSCGASAAVTVSAPPDGAALQGKTVYYPYTVTNVGSSVNTFALAAATGNGWETALLAENGAPTVTTGALSPGSSYRFQVAVSVPSSSTNGARADTRLSVTGEGASGSDEVTTTALAATVTVGESVRNITQGGTFQSSAAAFPGDTLEYRMSITNSGSAPATAVAIDTPVPGNSACVPGSLWIGTSSGGDGTPCPASECGWVREGGGTILAGLGQGATGSSGGLLDPGKTLYVYFRVQVE